MPWLGWLTAQEAAQDPYWPQCDLEDHELDALLTSARIQCEEYAPDVTHAASVRGAGTLVTVSGEVTDAVVPETWRRAQALQARALWRSSQAGAGDQIGADGLTVTVFPLDWTVKRLLRPQRGLPVLG